jgi:hypothetical protein
MVISARPDVPDRQHQVVPQLSLYIGARLNALSQLHMLIERVINVGELCRVRKIDSGGWHSLGKGQSRGRVRGGCKLLEYVHRWVFNHPLAVVRPPEIRNPTPRAKYSFLIFRKHVCDACAWSPGALVQADRRGRMDCYWGVQPARRASSYRSDYTPHSTVPVAHIADRRLG